MVLHSVVSLLEYSHHFVYLWHAQSEQCLCHPVVPLAQSSSLLSSQTVPCTFAGGKHFIQLDKQTTETVVHPYCVQNTHITKDFCRRFGCLEWNSIQAQLVATIFNLCPGLFVTWLCKKRILLNVEIQLFVHFLNRFWNRNSSVCNGFSPH